MYGLGCSILSFKCMRHSSVDIICDASLSVSSLILHVCETDSFLFSLYDVLLVLSVVAWGFGLGGGGVWGDQLLANKI